MNIVRFNPYRPFNTGRLFDDLDRAFGSALAPVARDGNVSFVPAVDLHTTDTHYVITADLPGVAPADIDVTVERGVLTIKGERAVRDASEKDGVSRVERRTGSFERRFTLPEDADGDRIEAKNAHGVLEVSIPKAEAAQPRRIEVAA